MAQKKSQTYTPNSQLSKLIRNTSETLEQVLVRAADGSAVVTILYLYQRLEQP